MSQNYTPQVWADGNPSYPLSAARLLHIENGIAAVDNAAASVVGRPISVQDQTNYLANAVMDGASHPLSTRFASLSEAQVVFPSAVALTDEIDYWAIQSLLASTSIDKIYLGAGTAVLHRSLFHRSGGGQEVWGEGPVATTLMLRAAANSNIFSPVDQNIANPNMVLRDFSVDGNKVNNTGTIGQTDGILLVRCDNLWIENVEARNVNGRGIHHHGLTGSVVEKQTWAHIYSHDNLHWGIWNSNGVRIVNYDDIVCNDNGSRTDLDFTNRTSNGADNFTGGFLLDHSEVQAEGIQCHRNGEEGLWLRNLFAAQINDVFCTRNGRDGIRVLGLVGSTGNTWTSQGNGANLALTGTRDIWFDGTSTLNYGVSSRTVVTDILAGPNAAAAIATQGAWSGNEAWGVYFDDGMAAGDLTGRGKVYAGTAGDVRLPANVGTLDWAGYSTTGSNGNPSDPTNFAVVSGSITDVGVTTTWTASKAVAPATVLNYTVYADEISGQPTSPLKVLAVVPRSDFTANGGVDLTGLTPGTTYLLGVKATDSTGADSNEVQAAGSFTTTSGAVVDVTSPNPPTGLNSTLVAATEVDLSYTAATDPPPNPSGIAYYTVYVNGVALPTQITDVNYAVTGLTPNTTYGFQVTATDNAGNESGATATLSRTTAVSVARRDVSSGMITAGGALTVAVPTTIITGDLVTAVVSTPSGTTITPPTGFAILPGLAVTTAGTEASGCYYRIAPGTAGLASTIAGTTLTVGLSGAPQKATVSLVAYSGVSATTPFDQVSVRAAPSAESDHTFGSFTTTFNGVALIGFLAEKDAATNVTVVTPSSNWTSGGGIIGTGGTSQQMSYAAFDTGSLYAPGLHGQNVHFVANQSTANAITWLAAVVPSGVGGGGGTDNQLPSTITATPTLTNKASNQMTLNWAAATDNVGVTAYKIYWDNGTGTLLTTAKQTVGNVLSMVISGLAASTAYKFAVTALDAAGNESAAKSPTATGSTTAGGGAARILFGINGDIPISNRTSAGGWVTNDGTSPAAALISSTGASNLIAMTRSYYPGDLPATFSAAYTVGAGGTNTYKRCNVCFKGKVGGADASPANVIAGTLDDQILTYCISVPSDWEIPLTWHHEPNGELTSSGAWSSANYKAAYQRIGALISGASMPAGQVAKQSAKSGSSISANIYTCLNYTSTRDGSENHGALIIASIPNASTMDPNSKLTWDAYQNPPPGGAKDFGTAAQDSFDTAGTVFAWFFGSGSNTLTAPVAGSPFITLGYNTTAHGWGICEWMAPYNQQAGVGGAKNTARPTATAAQQAAAMDAYLVYCENFNPRPYMILMWESPNGTFYNQTAAAAGRHVWANHANGPASRL